MTGGTGPGAFGSGEHMIKVDAMIAGERNLDRLDAIERRIRDHGLEGRLGHYWSVARRAIKQS